MKRILLTVWMFGVTAVLVIAQEATIKRTSEELKELFGYCEKADLVKQLKFSPDMADKIGEVDYWARLQQISIDANTNETYATRGELQQDVVKRYRALRMSESELKALLDFKKAREGQAQPCAAIALSYNPSFDTLAVPRALQLYKAKYRKQLIDQLGINGRQADMLMEAEVWKQKECLSINAIPLADFNRIRKTVAMYAEREKKYVAIGLNPEQIEKAVQFFIQNQVYAEQIKTSYPTS